MNLQETLVSNNHKDYYTLQNAPLTGQTENHHSNTSTGIKCCWIELKKDYTITNLFAIPIIYIPVTITIFFFTGQIIFLLKDPEYYNVSDQDISQVSNNLTQFSMPFQIIGVILMGYIYDLFGRRYSIFINLFLQALCFFIIPLGAPNVNPMVQIARTTQLVTNACTVVHPLINDYVLKKSRGMANALQVVGQCVGDIIIVVILKFLQDIEIGKQFMVTGIIIIVFSFLVLFMIQEPDMKK
ncbi:major facilitator superfamily mfs_1 [Stylonychia lemnae]|uniref:Major facilitator superfamily mfs_1 n=1 Tax=Stylonychia lemnae TaxID=5949 RepID=A0A077ZQL5_STYLE|nr:major facilitator superfamily mfs_1 [Stylonychia lemnae]|eukprot:CDW72202.1 major facilitator superfamily mfs_1 [Stylonychia lemnae]